MKDPFSIRLSDSEKPDRAKEFAVTLKRRGANPTDVLRHLVDAYVDSGGSVPFPVRLEELPETEYRAKPRKK